MDQIKRDFTHQMTFAESSNQSPAFRDHNDNTQGWWEIQRQAMMPQPDPVARQQLQHNGHPQHTGAHPEVFASQVPDTPKFGDVWGRGASLASHLSNDFFYQQNPAVQRYAQQYGQGGVGGFQRAHAEMANSGAGGGEMGRYGRVRESAEEVQEERIPLHLREWDPHRKSEGIGSAFKAVATAAKPHLQNAASHVGKAFGAAKTVAKAGAEMGKKAGSAVSHEVKGIANDLRDPAHAAGAAVGIGGAVALDKSMAKNKGTRGGRDGDGDGQLNESNQSNNSRIPMHLRDQNASYESYRRVGTTE